MLVFKSNGLKRERDCDVQKREGKNQARKEESEEHKSSDGVGLVIETSTIFSQFFDDSHFVKLIYLISRVFFFGLTLFLNFLTVAYSLKNHTQK